MFNQRSWLKIEFCKESDRQVLSVERMLTIPQYGDFIKLAAFPELWQVVDNPYHTVGTSEKGNYFHNITVQVRQVPLDTPKQEG